MATNSEKDIMLVVLGSEDPSELYGHIPMPDAKESVGGNQPNEDVNVFAIPLRATANDTSVESNPEVNQDSAVSSSARFFKSTTGKPPSSFNFNVAESIVNHDNGSVGSGHSSSTIVPWDIDVTEVEDDHG